MSAFEEIEKTIETWQRTKISLTSSYNKSFEMWMTHYYSIIDMTLKDDNDYRLMLQKLIECAGYCPTDVDLGVSPLTKIFLTPLKII